MPKGKGKNLNAPADPKEKNISMDEVNARLDQIAKRNAQRTTAAPKKKDLRAKSEPQEKEISMDEINTRLNNVGQNLRTKPKEERDLRAKSEPQGKNISMDEVNTRLDNISAKQKTEESLKVESKEKNASVKVGRRIELLQLQSKTVAQQLEDALESENEPKIAELTKQADKLTAEYCTLLGYSMNKNGKFSEKKLENSLTQEALEKQIEKTNQNPIFRNLEAGSSAVTALKNMNNISGMTKEEFSREATNSYVSDQARQRNTDAAVDKVLKDMGFDPAKLREQSAAALAKPIEGLNL